MDNADEQQYVKEEQVDKNYGALTARERVYIACMGASFAFGSISPSPNVNLSSTRLTVRLKLQSCADVFPGAPLV